MTKRELTKIGLGILIAILFGLILLTILSFTQNPENIVIEEEPIKKEEIVFQNSSSMAEKDIRELLEEKREEFKNFIENVTYYKVSEIAEGYTEEDDETYILLGLDFLEQFQSLVTEDFYKEYEEKLSEVTIKHNIEVTTRMFLAPIEIFDELYARSAITNVNVNEEALILVSATDEKIDAIENIKLCEEDSEYCVRDDKYNYILEKVEDTWRIAKVI